jgi:predicted DNA-binding transcriptional regulator AlpA
MNTKSPSIDGTLTISDLASLLRVTRRSIDNFRNNGTLPPPDFNIGKYPRWRVSTIEKALAALRPANSDEPV